jgi:hypothetical protein
MSSAIAIERHCAILHQNADVGDFNARLEFELCKHVTFDFRISFFYAANHIISFVCRI